GCTASACRPFWPWTTVNDTCWPSCRLLKPSVWIARKWTNTSSPFSRLMKPKPLASLNHLTVPVSRLDIDLLPGALLSWLVFTRAGVAGCKEEARCNDVAIVDQPHRATIHGDPGKQHCGNYNASGKLQRHLNAATYPDQTEPTWTFKPFPTCSPS